ncbi:hypothetical protein BJ741DRAFT_626823 [Chytriomyces cf. hyalinus JEL632]|nr:hypothetical protein BJ741DRAFT_626823 [Chytriomyces cf. hyalinus JEL632]
MTSELFRSEAELQEIAIVSLLLLSSTQQPSTAKSMYANSASLSAQLPWHMAGSQQLFQTPTASLPGSRVGSEEPLHQHQQQHQVILPPLSSLVSLPSSPPIPSNQLIIPSSPPTDQHVRRFSLMGLAAPIPASSSASQTVLHQAPPPLQLLETLTETETVSSPASIAYTSSTTTTTTTTTTTIKTASKQSREGIRATKEQLKVLLSVFEENATPTGLEHSQIGERIGMSRKAVRNWFQNYRAKVRRQSVNSGTATRGGGGGLVSRSGSGSLSESESGVGLSPPSLVAGGSV